MNLIKKYEVDSSQNNEEETNLSQGTKTGGRGGRTLIKKKTKVSSYIRKFRWDRMQSNISGRAS
jgi:hypothetical protein